MIRILVVVAAMVLTLVGAPAAGHATVTDGCPDPAVLPPTPFRDMWGSAHRDAVVCADWYGVVNGAGRDAFAPRRTVRRDQMAAMMARLVTSTGTPLPASRSTTFVDVDGSPHRRDIAVVTALGVIDRTGDRFRPRARVARGDVATWLVRLAGVVDVSATGAPDAFTDDDGTTAEQAIDQAAALGLVEGRADGTFGADEVVRRDQAASVLARTIQVLVEASVLEHRPVPAFAVRRSAVPEWMRSRMTGHTWRSGCPVALDDLVLVQVTHWDYASEPRRGRLIVARRVAADVSDAMADLYRARFRIRRMRPVHRYPGGERGSLNDNNTSAFNCRRVTGGDGWSQHSYGTAVDINPRQNPYVAGTTVLPRGAGRWVRRSPLRRGMISLRGPAVAAFDAIGWGWGGRWRSLKDYQHFSATGR